jgi:hypothetical protein
MHGKVIIVASLHTGKQAVGSHILWWDTEKMKESSQWHAMKYSKEFNLIRTLCTSLRSPFLCLKYIMKKFKIYSKKMRVKNPLED